MTMCIQTKFLNAIFAIGFVLIANSQSVAQQDSLTNPPKIADSESATRTSVILPKSPVRIIAEWEDALGTMIAWPLSLPDEMVVELAKDDQLFVLVNSDKLEEAKKHIGSLEIDCLLYTSPSPRDKRQSRMPSSA